MALLARTESRRDVAPDTGLLKEWPTDGPTLLWKVTGIGKGFSTVTISNGRIYTTGDIDDTLVMTMLDMNGKEIGKVPVDKAWTKSRSGSRSTPTIDGDRVYLLSGHGKLVCHHGGYVVHEGHIYGNNGGGWACLELKTGKRLWNEKGVGKGSLCYADGMLYLFSERGGKAALATCSTKGLEIKGNVTVQGDGPSWAHPVVIGGRLYLRYADNIYCFDVKATE